MGSITAGKKAEFVLLNQNPLAVSLEKLKEIKIEALILEGSEQITRLVEGT